MATNLAIDDALIEEARRIGQHRTKKEAVTAALLEYIRYRKRLELIEMAGTVDYHRDYDHKKLRSRRSAR
jgi:Arc/MetJ family transcription regulator